MRLGQLSRKLSVRSSEIVEFLRTKNIVIVDGSNTRIEDEYLSLIVNHFAPGTTLNDEVQATEKNLLETPDQIKEEVIISQPLPETVDEVETSAETMSEDKTELIPEVIKAPKVELQGLKVLGKIELPEKKKKEVPTESPVETGEVKNDFHPRPMKKHRSENRPRKNPVVLERERQEREAEEKRKRQAEQEKERRTKNYYNRVKHSVPTKAARMVEEPVTHINEVDMTESPRTLWGKFLKWLTSY